MKFCLVENLKMKTSRLLLFILSSLLPLLCVTINAQAQNKERQLERAARTPADPDNRISRLPGISVQTRWKKDYGLPYNNRSGSTAAYPSPCDSVVFVYRSKTMVPDRNPNQAGRVSWRDVGAWTYANPTINAAEDGEYYVCRYSISDLPLDRTISIEADINPSFLPPAYNGFDKSVRLTAPWVGGSQPQPPPGYQRVLIGNRQVTLTEKQPRATVDFELAYRPLATPPE